MADLEKGKWSKIPHSVLDIRNLVDLLQYMLMRMTMFDDGLCKHSQDRIAGEIGVKLRAVQQSQVRLVAGGWIQKVEAGRRTYYRVMLPHNKDLFVAKKHVSANTFPDVKKRVSLHGETCLPAQKDVFPDAPRLDTEVDTKPDTTKERVRESDASPFESDGWYSSPTPEPEPATPEPPIRMYECDYCKGPTECKHSREFADGWAMLCRPCHDYAETNSGRLPAR